MNQVKRLWTDLEHPEVPEKKHRRDSNAQETISCIETLPNEIFLEIFEYLDGEKLLKAFTDLNARVENLLDVANLRIQTTRCPNYFVSSQDFFDKIIPSNSHRILALNLVFRSIPLINASFIRLESLRLREIESVNLIPLLISLADVPRLTSLHVDLCDIVNDLSTIYQLIFALPSIKHLRMGMGPFHRRITCSMPTADQSTTLIESLAVDHACTVDDLLVLLSYTPRLRRLQCEWIAEAKVPLPPKKVNTTPTLIRVSINRWTVDFDRLEAFLTIVAPELQYLTIKCYKKVAFLSAERWERVITQHFPHLSTFNFTYVEAIDEDFVVTQHHEQMHRFTSPFWINKHCWFNVRIGGDTWNYKTVSYIVSTDKKKNRKSIDQEMKVPFPTTLTEDNQLLIIELPNLEANELYMPTIGPMLVSSQLTCLHVDVREIFAGTLIDFIQHLPHLHSLVVKSLGSMRKRHLSLEESTTLRLVTQRKSITKVRLMDVDRLSKIQFLIDLCSGMQYLQIDDTNDLDLEYFVRFILMKNIKYLQSLVFLSFGCPKWNIDLLTKLDKMIAFEQLRRDYTIERIDDKIYLRWTV